MSDPCPAQVDTSCDPQCLPTTGPAVVDPKCGVEGCSAGTVFVKKFAGSTGTFVFRTPAAPLPSTLCADNCMNDGTIWSEAIGVVWAMGAGDVYVRFTSSNAAWRVSEAINPTSYCAATTKVCFVTMKSMGNAVGAFSTLAPDAPAANITIEVSTAPLACP